MKTTRHEMRMRGYTVRWGKYDIASTAILEGGRCDGLPDGWETAKSRRMAEEVRILDDDGKVLDDGTCWRLGKTRWRITTASPAWGSKRAAFSPRWA